MPGRATQLVPVHPAHPDAAVLRQAAAVVRGGGLVAFPTETVYGLGANALDPVAVRSIFEAKGRPVTNPVIVHVAGDEMLRRVVADWPAKARLLAERFWPGPLTLVLPRSGDVPDDVSAGGPTVGVRMPAHAVALGLIREAGVPIAAPSANRSSELSPTTAAHVIAGLDGRIDLILDAGPTANGIESTVLDLSADPPRLLRPGPIRREAIEALVGPVRLLAEVPSGPLPSPGLLPRHYAPRTAVELFDTSDALERRGDEFRRASETVGKVLFGRSDDSVNTVAMPSDPADFASRLYAVLHDLDGRGLTRILVELPPDTAEWVAVRDRLIRAATP